METTEAEHMTALDLRAARQEEQQAENQRKTEEAQTDGSKPDSGAPSSGNIAKNQAVWLIVFGFAAIAWLVALGAGFLIPPAYAVINFVAVGGIWFWAKISHLKPPTFSSSVGKAGKAASAAGGAAAKAAQSAESAVPGMDMLYILLGGIHPVAYAFALWLGNR